MKTYIFILFFAMLSVSYTASAEDWIDRTDREIRDMYRESDQKSYQRREESDRKQALRLQQDQVDIERRRLYLQQLDGTYQYPNNPYPY